jgi:hypothetical protein
LLGRGTDRRVRRLGITIADSLSPTLHRAEWATVTSGRSIPEPAHGRLFDGERNVLDIDRRTALSGLTPMSLREGLDLTIAAEIGSRGLY